MPSRRPSAKRRRGSKGKLGFEEPQNRGGRGRGGPKPIVFSGGSILTMGDPLRVDALTIQGDRIVWAGTLEECRAMAGSDREEQDLAGRALIPGFVDAPCHPLMLGQTQSWLDISPDVAPSIVDLVALLAQHARRLPAGV